MRKDNRVSTKVRVILIICVKTYTYWRSQTFSPFINTSQWAVIFWLSARWVDRECLTLVMYEYYVRYSMTTCMSWQMYLRKVKRLMSLHKCIECSMYLLFHMLSRCIGCFTGSVLNQYRNNEEQYEDNKGKTIHLTRYQMSHCAPYVYL